MPMNKPMNKILVFFGILPAFLFVLGCLLVVFGAPKLCAPGTFGPNGFSLWFSSCEECKAGEYSTGGVGECTACGTGTTSAAGASKCEPNVAGAAVARRKKNRR
jgi:hypothetical protein